MHLLNDVLPAAASCASAAGMAADDAMITSALSVSFFILGLFIAGGCTGACLWHGACRIDKGCELLIFAVWPGCPSPREVSRSAERAPVTPSTNCFGNDK